MTVKKNIFQSWCRLVNLKWFKTIFNVHTSTHRPILWWRLRTVDISHTLYYIFIDKFELEIFGRKDTLRFKIFWGGNGRCEKNLLNNCFSFCHPSFDCDPSQRDQIWRNFATLATSLKSWGIFFWGGGYFLIDIVFVTTLGKFSFM